MLAIVLSWLFCFTPTGAYPVQTTMAADSLILQGSCWDVLTGRNVPSTVTTIINGQKRHLGHSNATGEFTLRISDSTKVLSFEVNGYPTITLPISRVGTIDKSARFKLELPMIRSDSQEVIKPYPPTAPLTSERTRFKRNTQKVYFQVHNARTFRRIPASICFTYSSSGRTHCVEVDSAKVPSDVQLIRGEKVRFQVSAWGYQPYSGELASDQPEASLHQIKLLMLNNVLVAAYQSATNEKLDQYEFRNSANTLIGAGNSLAPSFGWNHFQPGKVYRYLASAGKGKFVADQTFQMAAGLTFVQFHFSPRASRPLVGNESLRPTYFDSTVLYFDQSQYALRREVQGKLDSISWKMIQQRNVMAELIGHTDNVGQRKLNLNLAEYRTRVVSNYLQQKGVELNQLSSRWKGPDAPVAPNDTEINKAKNRRVVIRFFSKK